MHDDVAAAWVAVLDVDHVATPIRALRLLDDAAQVSHDEARAWRVALNQHWGVVVDAARN